MEGIKEELVKLSMIISSIKNKYKITYSDDLQKDLYEIADCLTRIEFEIWRKENKKNEL